MAGISGDDQDLSMITNNNKNNTYTHTHIYIYIPRFVTKSQRALSPLPVQSSVLTWVKSSRGRGGGGGGGSVCQAVCVG